MEKLLNYIGGIHIPAVSGQWINVENPATGKVYAHLARSGAPDVENAVLSAEAAFGEWSTSSAEERANKMLKLAMLVETHLEEFAIAETIDNGKPINLSRRIDIPRVVSNLKFFAHMATTFSSESHFMPGVAVNYTVRAPIGIVGCISPWNLPLYLFSWKIAPALAAGNCVIAKPSEVTPYTAYLLSSFIKEAGIPDGVFNIVHGYGHEVGAAIVAHPKIKAISFTGGTATGQTIIKTAGPMFKKLSLELGGKNPNILFDDCDYDLALETSVRSSFANQGQICLCGSRILVQEALYDRVVEDFVRKAQSIVPSNPMSETSKLGALVSKSHMDKVLSYVELAKKEGGNIRCGGYQVVLSDECSGGYFMAPAVITDLDMSCRTNQEEIFGPVVTITPFKDEAEALQLANRTAYGLSASIWTQDIDKAQRMALGVDAGIIWINTWLQRDLRTPFGGVKQSGLGREGGEEAMRFFTEAKNICVALK